MKRSSRFRAEVFAGYRIWKHFGNIEAVFDGNARSFLDFPDRPEAYDDAGHTWNWNRRRMRHWPRSAYEKVIHRVIARQPLQIRGQRYVAERMQGWVMK